ncbi:hypothetical protein [Streptomyces sp. NPDC002521]
MWLGGELGDGGEDGIGAVGVDEVDQGLQVAYWAMDIPVAERAGAWVAVLESILRVWEFTSQESWESGLLLRALVGSAHPGGRLCTGQDRLGGILRSALAGVLADHLGDGDEDARFHAAIVNNFGEVTPAEPPPTPSATVRARGSPPAVQVAQDCFSHGPRLDNGRMQMTPTPRSSVGVP